MTDKPKRRRRWLQFSLRTMLVVVTVFCIWLGIATKRARDQRRAVEMIHGLGGTVAYEHEKPWSKTEPPGPEWLRRLVGDEYFFSVHSLYFTQPQTSEASLAEITKLTEAKHLHVFYTKISDIGVEHLKGATTLRKITLIETQNTLEDMKKLQQALPNCGIVYSEDGWRKWSLPVWSDLPPQQ